MNFTIILMIITTIGISFESFCEQYVANNESLYQYDHQISGRVLHLLVIGRKFWSFGLDIDPISIESRLKLDESIHESDSLAGDYETGFSLLLEKNRTVTGLVKRNSSAAFVEWKAFGRTGKGPNGSSRELSGLTSNGPIVSTSERDSVTFLTTEFTNNSMVRKLVEYRVENGTNALLKMSNETEDTVVDDISASYEVIARFKDGNPECNRRTLCYLFRANRTLKYCVVESDANLKVSL